MSNETREVRGKVPAAVADRIEHAMRVLGAPMIEIVGGAVEAGLEATVCELARHRAAELAAFLPPETVNGTGMPDRASDDIPSRKPGRAERQAAVKAEELKEQRRRKRSPSKTPRDPVD